MASIEYTTSDGDVIDDIIDRFYGITTGVEVMHYVFLANPGLAAKGTVYPSGVVIVLPDIPNETAVKPINRPWGKVS